jgi:hypothetical protein
VGEGERVGVAEIVVVGVRIVGVNVESTVAVNVGVLSGSGVVLASPAVILLCEQAHNPRLRNQIKLRIPIRFNRYSLQYPPSLSEEQ